MRHIGLLRLSFMLNFVLTGMLVFLLVQLLPMVAGTEPIPFTAQRSEGPALSRPAEEMATSAEINHEDRDAQRDTPGAPAANSPSEPEPAGANRAAPLVPNAMPLRATSGMRVSAESPTPLDSGTRTQPAEPLAAELAEPTPAELVADGDWLGYLNAFRAQAGVPSVSADDALSRAAGNHGTYMVYEDVLEHMENPDSNWYSREGDQAARRSNIVASSDVKTPFNWAIEYWISAPFHAIPLLNPALTTIGFGVAREAVGSLNMASALDVASGVDEAVLTADSYPVMFPGDGGQTWVVRSSLSEWPSPLSACDGYERPLGAPVVLMLGPDAEPAQVTAHSLRLEGITPVEHCVLDAAGYAHATPAQEKAGKQILSAQNAVVLMPRSPLEVGSTYDVDLTVNGERYTWSFETIDSGIAVKPNP